LDVKPRVRKELLAIRVVAMHVGNDHVSHLFRVDTDEPQTLGPTRERVALLRLAQVGWQVP
jgi:hypothetical protein